ncbi:hypothetical protein CYY_000454 [Polysphondylium violaceum]|uniref:Uncharacterized protein n=1 Tax=Polysphondylium violaceum TaxID=133409 RepID=A0A8J4Q4T7_9MYCE|nr:hypothetical protein CYY_000454 [Polysphondylium violaceum]
MITLEDEKNLENIQSITINQDLKKEFIKLPWHINAKQYTEFDSVNEDAIISPFTNQDQVEITVSTPIDVKPLLPFFKRVFGNPCLSIIEANCEKLLIETQEEGILFIKQSSPLSEQQCTTLFNQTMNWYKKNNITSSSLFSSSIRYNLQFEYENQKKKSIFIPDISLLTNLKFDKLPSDHNYITKVPPEFFIIVKRDEPGETNKLWFLQKRMAFLIMAGAQSGVLIDNQSIYLYARSNLQELSYQPREQFEKYNSDLSGESDLNTQLYFNDLKPVGQLFPNVSKKAIPFNNNNNFGPNMVLHCIGVANGLKLNLSEIPLK